MSEIENSFTPDSPVLDSSGAADIMATETVAPYKVPFSFSGSPEENAVVFVSEFADYTKVSTFRRS